MPSFPGSPGGGSTIDLGYAAELGRLLTAARQERDLSIEQVAERLLLSPRQVRALERPDPTAFYGEPYFVKGLQKYVEFAGVGGLSEDLFERMLTIPGRPDADVAPVRLPEPAAPSSGGARMRSAALAVVVVALAVAGGAYYLLGGFQGRLGAPAADLSAAAGDAATDLPAAGGDVIPAEPVEARAELPFESLRAPVVAEAFVPAPDPPAPAAARAPAAVPAVAPGDRGAAASGGAGAGRVSVPRATWVFVRYANDETVERVLQPGQALDLRSVPIYLAVGIPNPDVTIGGQPVDVQPWVTDARQVRIGRADLAALARR
ncbi:MAG: helix-turn-helix domain-containing protein [Vicinamibacterales bacterium]